MAHHMMQVQLRHQVTERPEIQLFALKGREQEGAHAAGLVEQPAAIIPAEFVDLANTRSPRHQDHPGVTAVVEQQCARQREIADAVTVRLQAWVTRRW